MRRLLWIWALISVCWAILIIAPNWSKKPPEPLEVSQRDLVPWGQVHRECRDRLAFWPDGTRIEDRDLTPLLATPQNQLTDRERWARDIWYKVKDCNTRSGAPSQFKNNDGSFWALRLCRQLYFFL
jgi:hypothetical protein